MPLVMFLGVGEKMMFLDDRIVVTVGCDSKISSEVWQVIESVREEYCLRGHATVAHLVAHGVSPATAPLVEALGAACQADPDGYDSLSHWRTKPWWERSPESYAARKIG